MVAGPRMGHGISWLYRDELLFKKNRGEKHIKSKPPAPLPPASGTILSLGRLDGKKGVPNRIQIRLTVELGYPHTCAGWQNAELGLQRGDSQLSPTSPWVWIRGQTPPAVPPAAASGEDVFDSRSLAQSWAMPGA